MTTPQPLPGWLLIISALLSVVAAIAGLWWDQPLIDFFRPGGLWHDWAFCALILTWGPIVLATLITVALHAPTSRERALQFAVLLGGLCVFGGLNACDRAAVLTGVAAFLLHLATRTVGWVTVTALMARGANGGRLVAGLAVTLLCSTLLNYLLKWLVGRARPYTNLGVWHMQPGDGQAAFESFPSGHSSAAAAVAGFLTLVFPRGAPVFILFALATGFERVVADMHFPSDVLAGWAIGLLGALLAYRLLGPGCFTRWASTAKCVLRSTDAAQQGGISGPAHCHEAEVMETTSTAPDALLLRDGATVPPTFAGARFP